MTSQGAASVRFKKALMVEDEVNDDNSVEEHSLDGSVSSLEEGIEIVDDTGKLMILEKSRAFLIRYKFIRGCHKKSSSQERLHQKETDGNSKGTEEER